MRQCITEALGYFGDKVRIVRRGKSRTTTQSFGRAVRAPLSKVPLSCDKARPETDPVECLAESSLCCRKGLCGRYPDGLPRV